VADKTRQLDVIAQDIPDYAAGRMVPDKTRQLDVIAQEMPDYAVFALSADGMVTSWNDGAQRIKGYRSDEIIGRHFSVFYPPERVASAFPQWELEQAARTGFFIDQGWRLRKDGTRFWAHVLITAQRSSTGELTGFVKVTRDESEVQARQQRASRRFTDLFDLAPVGTGLFDDAGRVLDANQALCDLLGYELPEIVGKSATDLLHPSDEATGLTPPSLPATELLEQRTHWPRSLLRRDGRTLVCDVHCTVSAQDDGTRFLLAVFQDITEQTHHAERLHHQATHDRLTGLRNRDGVEELLDGLLKQQPQQVAVLLCDLDNFKRVNDALGHGVGDELLVAVARKLARALPPTCTPARLYGDEFLITCCDVHAHGGVDALAATVSELLHTAVPLHDRLVHISASISAATADDTHTTTDDLLQSVDAAMVDAKQDPGHGMRRPGHVAMRARPTRVHSMTRQLSLEEFLHTALRHDNLTLHYQPIVDRDGHIIAAETLLRVSHPQHGLLSPATILPVAEQGGLLPELDRWVLRTALHEATRWPAEQKITVNLSGLRPDDPGFSGEISHAITTTGIDAHRVILEMVESIFVDLPQPSCDAMSDLRAIGLRFAMDDFGTGYSSLSRLKNLPTQILKLDRGFVFGLGTEPSDLGIARAVVEVAHATGRDCIAEGVETPTQFHTLRQLGIHGYQGWLFSHAIPAQQFRALLNNPTLPTP
jgi:diguanylate cyclase (GGDEF)-like protein/PAS domain S-box-containing protein